MNILISDGQRIARQIDKRNERIDELGRLGVQVKAQDLNGARIGAKEMDLFIRLLKKHGKPRPCAT